MADISITQWMDPALKYFADQARIPVSDFSSQVGGEGIGNALEMTANFFTKGWLNKAIQGLAGLIANSYAIWGKDVPTRLRKELLAVGTHELLRIADPSPKDVIEARQSLEDFIAATQRGDWNAALSSVLTTPAEIQAMFGVPRITLPPTTTPAVLPPTTIVPAVVGAGRYQVSVEEAPVYGTAPSGRYMVAV
ncbi:hypothetical protein ES702_03863 [subsurface metagenome]